MFKLAISAMDVYQTQAGMPSGPGFNLKSVITGLRLLLGPSGMIMGEMDPAQRAEAMAAIKRIFDTMGPLAKDGANIHSAALSAISHLFGDATTPEQKELYKRIASTVSSIMPTVMYQMPGLADSIYGSRGWAFSLLPAWRQFITEVRPDMLSNPKFTPEYLTAQAKDWAESFVGSTTGTPSRYSPYGFTLSELANLATTGAAKGIINDPFSASKFAPWAPALYLAKQYLQKTNPQIADNPEALWSTISQASPYGGPEEAVKNVGLLTSLSSQGGLIAATLRRSGKQLPPGLTVDAMTQLSSQLSQQAGNSRMMRYAGALQEIARHKPKSIAANYLNKARQYGLNPYFSAADYFNIARRSGVSPHAAARALYAGNTTGNMFSQLDMIRLAVPAMVKEAYNFVPFFGKRGAERRYNLPVGTLDVFTPETFSHMDAVIKENEDRASRSLEGAHLRPVGGSLGRVVDYLSEQGRTAKPPGLIGFIDAVLGITPLSSEFHKLVPPFSSEAKPKPLSEQVPVPAAVDMLESPFNTKRANFNRCSLQQLFEDIDNSNNKRKSKVL